ncbi:MAG: hypothetical protein ABS75_26040 [Pelagibacterium sp. SCN 63-23]|nr:MAG: hypothetical protein ABS75_26040 [Pelagibacterium sp. SCN 63-23]
MARKLIKTRVVLPLLVASLLVQAVVPLARVLTSYQALDLGLGPEIVGVLSATFAILPVLLTILVGRFNDGGSVARMSLAGAICTLLACLVLWLPVPSLPTLLLGTAILGIGQIMLLSSLQVITSLSSTRQHRDTVLGNYMVAMSLGQAVGPLFFGLPRDGWLLPAIPVIGSTLLIVATLVLLRVVHVRENAHTQTKVPLREIAATPGLLWIVLTGSICVAALDLLLAFLPVLGEERGIAPATIGLLLSIRAAAAMIPRLVFGQAVRRFGRMPLMLASSGMGGIGLLMICLPLPVWAMAVTLALIGTGLGIALASSVGLTMDIAPIRARGTALSMRLTVHRLAQFFLPLAAGLIVAPLGVAGIFGVTGVTLLAALFARPRAL